VRALVIAMLALLTAVGCAGTLKRHAQAASVSAQVIDGVGAAIEREDAEDYAELLRLPAEERQARVAVLKPQYHAVRVAYDAARAALRSYRRAIVEANANGTTLRPEIVQMLRDAWLGLTDAADRLGIEVPTVPELLVRLAGDKR
jgi:DnaJ-domain-containing protein 1